MNYKYKNILTPVCFARDVAKQTLGDMAGCYIHHYQSKSLAITGATL
jgi:hypothetical protein